MKGVVFTEFLEMVENNYSAEMVDDIIDASDLVSLGAYTSVGTYDHGEILQLVSALSQATGASVAELVKLFGKHLFARFSVVYPQFFNGVSTAFEFLAHIDDTVHSEVRKLYPDAELPTFSPECVNEEQLIMNYKSTRPFGDLAEGLILGCIDYFAEPLTIHREDVVIEVDQTHVRFIIKRH